MCKKARNDIGLEVLNTAEFMSTYIEFTDFQFLQFMAFIVLRSSQHTTVLLVKVVNKIFIHQLERFHTSLSVILSIDVVVFKIFLT